MPISFPLNFAGPNGEQGILQLSFQSCTRYLGLACLEASTLNMMIITTVSCNLNGLLRALQVGNSIHCWRRVLKHDEEQSL